jgi:hypothetical protein
MDSHELLRGMGVAHTDQPELFRVALETPMSIDVLRSVASPLLNAALGKLTEAAPRQAQAPAPTQAAQKPTGLRVLDGFDDAMPAVRSAAATGQTAAPGAQPADAALAQQPAEGAGKDNNPLSKLLEVFTGFIKQFLSMFLGSLGNMGGGAQAPAAGAAPTQGVP